MLQAESTKPRRIELILRQIDALPTLPAIATRLLTLTASDESHAREVIDLIRSDPALTGKVLSLCRTADKGVNSDVLTVDRAVVLLGFNAIRNAVLSIKVFELFDQQPADDAQRTLPRIRRSDGCEDGQDTYVDHFNRPAFWTHCLATAIMAELIAAAHPNDRDIRPDEAFVAGLLHDIGKLALDVVLPKSFSRVIELTDLNQGNIAEFERRIVGIDHHTAGKRLAEQWKLPLSLQDCIWLHGSAYDTLPRLEHRRLIGVISLADAIARRQHLGYSGNFMLQLDERDLCTRLDLNHERVQQAAGQLHQQLEQRSKVLGVNDKPSHELFLQSIQQANAALGKLNQALQRRSRTTAQQARILEGISAFHATATPGQSVQDVLDSVADSARTVFGAGFLAILYPADDKQQAREKAADGQSWLISQYTDDARPVHSQYVEAPPYAPDLRQFDVSQPLGMNLMGLMPWLVDYLVNAPDLRTVRLLPLPCGWGTAGFLLHDQQTLPAWGQLAALASTWGSAVAAAAQHDGARRLGEQLAEANSALADAQDRLLRQASMARLGEMAAGAAHEMNNPLAVISGRSQLLSMSLKPGGKEHDAAMTIYREAHKLSDLITSLHLFADPPRPQKRLTDVAALVDDTVKRVQAAQTKRGDDTWSINLIVGDKLPLARIDPDHIRDALTELLRNAMQANPRHAIQVELYADRAAEGVMIKVVDDGEGMDSHTLEHAMDPFFSAKRAGRRVGMGLPRAKQLLAAQGGQLQLRSAPGKGTSATLLIPLDSPA